MSPDILDKQMTEQFAQPSVLDIDCISAEQIERNVISFWCKNDCEKSHYTYD